MKTKHLPVILGTARPGRESEKVARFVASVLNSVEGVTTEIVDVRDHVQNAVTVPPWGKGGANEVPTRWKEIVLRSHALILVVPEYNHGYPGELKLLLDSLWDDYRNMPVGLVGVSKGTFGGARVIDHLKPVLIEMKLTPIREAVYVSKVTEAINEHGEPADSKLTEYVEGMAKVLVNTRVS
jgi:NAD(P)H-dependent FMN reductase